MFLSVAFILCNANDGGLTRTSDQTLAIPPGITPTLECVQL
jgi:hypothetical protein